MLRPWLPLSAVLLALAAAPALGQTNIRPDTTPRLPQQPGQGLPLEDREFLTRALNLSEAEIEAGRLAAERAPELRDFAQGVIADHDKLRQGLEQLAQKTGAPLQPHAQREWWQGELQRIRGLSGPDFARDYMNWQLQTHLALANLYQVQASNTTQTDLSKFAIIALAQIQRRFDEAKRIGAGLGVQIDTVKQPPQY